jgi:LysM repeat protein
MKFKNQRLTFKKNLLEKAFNISFAKNFSQKVPTPRKTSFSQKRKAPTNNIKNLNESKLNQNLVLQFLSFTIIICFTILFFQSILGESVSNKALTTDINKNSIKVFTNFSETSLKSKSKDSEAKLVETSSVKTLDANSSVISSSKNSLSSSTSSSSNLNKEQSENYVVKSGDSLFTIAKSQKTTVQKIAELNDLEPPYNIKTGQKLIISQQ